MRSEFFFSAVYKKQLIVDLVLWFKLRNAEFCWGVSLYFHGEWGCPKFDFLIHIEGDQAWNFSFEKECMLRHESIIEYKIANMSERGQLEIPVSFTLFQIQKLFLNYIQLWEKGLLKYIQLREKEMLTEGGSRSFLQEYWHPSILVLLHGKRVLYGKKLLRTEPPTWEEFYEGRSPQELEPSAWEGFLYRKKSSRTWAS